jgi:hypothetical protein
MKRISAKITKRSSAVREDAKPNVSSISSGTGTPLPAAAVAAINGTTGPEPVAEIIGGPAVILGENAKADGNGNVSIGPGASTKGKARVAIGSDAIANSTLFGANNQQIRRSVPRRL